MAVKARQVISILLLALLAPWLYDRYIALSISFGNMPGRFKPVYNITSHDILFQDRVRNCEDLLLDEGMGIAILSCDPGRDRWNTVMGTFRNEKNLENGRLWLYDYTSPDLDERDRLQPLTFLNFPNENDFHPLGLELDTETSTLYVVSHAQSGSCIEVFKLSVKDIAVTHVQTYKHPLIHAPNSIADLGGGKLYVTNDHYMRAAISPLLSKAESWLAPPLASVAYTDLAHPENTKLVARVPFANGISMLNSTTLVVASSSTPAIFLYEVQADHSLALKKRVRCPAAVDNISVDSSGAILMAGHPAPVALIKVSKSRQHCNRDSEIEAEREACECNAPSWVGEWTEGGGLRTLYKGWEFCSSTMAVRDRRRELGLVSGLYDKGIMAFREK